MDSKAGARRAWARGDGRGLEGTRERTHAASDRRRRRRLRRGKLRLQHGDGALRGSLSGVELARGLEQRFEPGGNSINTLLRHGKR
ncbi:hypothetical protein HETIRDRAFT_433973 [Heterobasidion irregulare TC 32-1]|uniref:Uncharacterized protein n=1 Tax=Heterobasidion irregulare (strain TC 32-1) TaxID=747525 RepID=W4K622_HETIT|nr:uncharacterized protein HETIRDRAFT_433973 [Heterobasidion irregulare TC 32-1]ETW81262.1 hypothetical protein HETIRDRAFT_433973 [Heterobasidion irregulare TC 32-1]